MSANSPAFLDFPVVDFRRLREVDAWTEEGRIKRDQFTAAAGIEFGSSNTPGRRRSDLAELFGSQPEGWKFTLRFSCLFGGEATQRYTFGGVVEHHGYDTPGGSWGLAQFPGDAPSYRAKVRRYRERRWRWLVLDSADSFDDGWGES